MLCEAQRVPYRLTFGRSPAVAAEAMIATSQPLATAAGLRAFERGGNAVDAALAAAAMLCVTEPMWTGVGGDLFAQVWKDGALEGLDAAGPAPARADPVEPVETRGPRSVTVPGAVRGWEALADRHSLLGLGAALVRAVDAAEHGVAIAPRAAAMWEQADGPGDVWPRPRVGERFRIPDLASTLRGIAEHGPEAFYGGRVAEAIASATWLEESDLAGFRPRWVEPLRASYRGVEVTEMPPPTQGVVALEGLKLLEPLEPTLENQVRSVARALEDGFANVRDGADVSALLAGSTTYLCAVDGDRTAISLIQSLFDPFGSRVVAPGTGVLLQNRGAGFAVSGRVEPGRRPYHTIIPGMLFRDGSLVGPFGIHGGLIQAQAHVQFVSAVVDDGLDPQAALERGRFKVDGKRVALEESLAEEAGELAGFETFVEPNVFEFGGGQAIFVEGDALAGGSDPRKDGYAGGL
jgi:gamma-glutamyltranspeptidase/glutathione hydrolase